MVNNKRENKGEIALDENFNEAKTNDISSMSNSNSIQDFASVDENSIHDILKRLDIQLLLSVLVYFLTAWIFLNNKICNFTGAETQTMQMSYILVHYVLTLTLLLCLSLTAIKSYLMININCKMWIINLFKLFLESWYWILAICFFTIILSGSFKYEWLLSAAILITFLILKMADLKYSKTVITLTVITITYLFFLFISTMTSIIREVEIETDKPFYSFSDKVLITVNTRGYACNHKLIGLGEKYRDVQYYSDKGLIVLNATQIKNNEVAIATLSPATGVGNFFLLYPWGKITGKDAEYENIDPNDINKIRSYCDFSPKSIYVKP